MQQLKIVITKKNMKNLWDKMTSNSIFLKVFQKYIYERIKTIISPTKRKKGIPPLLDWTKNHQYRAPRIFFYFGLLIKMLSQPWDPDPIVESYDLSVLVVYISVQKYSCLRLHMQYEYRFGALSYCVYSILKQ